VKEGVYRCSYLDIDFGRGVTTVVRVVQYHYALPPPPPPPVQAPVPAGPRYLSGYADYECMSAQDMLLVIRNRTHTHSTPVTLPCNTIPAAPARMQPGPRATEVDARRSDSLRLLSGEPTRLGATQAAVTRVRTHASDVCGYNLKLGWCQGLRIRVGVFTFDGDWLKYTCEYGVCA
jgi:hypothetical protein